MMEKELLAIKLIELEKQGFVLLDKYEFDALSRTKWTNKILKPNTKYLIGDYGSYNCSIIEDETDPNSIRIGGGYMPFKRFKRKWKIYYKEARANFLLKRFFCQTCFHEQDQKVLKKDLKK